MSEHQVKGEYLLKKFSGKGGWTYAEIPEIQKNKNNPFGWVQVSGSIDKYELNKYKLMPMGNGQLFLPVKADIRKFICKQAGDTVSITLSIDEAPMEIPPEIMECFEFEPNHIFEVFMSFTEGERKAYLDWVYNAKTEDTKTSRIASMMDCLNKGLKYHEKE